MDTNIPSIDITKISQTLTMRKKMYSPTILFLGARAGALFHNENLYETLNLFSNQDLASQSSKTEKFQSCIRLLEQKKLSEQAMHYILLHSLQDTFTLKSNEYIAMLIKHGFFNMVITTNIDTGLEEALLKAELRMKHDFDVLVPSAHMSTPSTSLYNRSSPFTLAKIYGDLAPHKYNLKQRNQLLQEDEELYQLLHTVRGWNLLMVGFDSLWDAAALPFLFPRNATLWFVNEEIPAKTSPLFKYLQESQARSISGTQADSESFFKSLVQQVIGNILPGNQNNNILDNPLSTIRPKRWEFIKVQEYAQKQKQTGTIVKDKSNKADVLLIVNTDNAIHTILRLREEINDKQLLQDEPYYEFGVVGDARIFFMKIELTDDIYTVKSTFDKNIQELCPSSIIFLGCAQGFRYKGQRLGDVLVSEQIITYEMVQDLDRETQQKNTDIYNYMQRQIIKISPDILSIFRNGSIILARKAKKPIPVRFGLIFISTETADKETSVFHYINRFVPDAIGIEATSAILYLMAQHRQINYLLVKGISGWADENVEQEVQHQDSAISNAAQFILQIIAQGGLALLA